MAADAVTELPHPLPPGVELLPDWEKLRCSCTPRHGRRPVMYTVTILGISPKQYSGSLSVALLTINEALPDRPFAIVAASYLAPLTPEAAEFLQALKAASLLAGRRNS